MDLPTIVNLYVRNGVFSFIIDFQGNNPIDIYTHVDLIHNLVRGIKREYNEEVYLHAFNIPFTRVKNRIDATPAKDIITFLLGFDSFGSNHLPQKLPLEVVQKIRERQGRKFVSWSNQGQDPSHVSLANQPETFRILNRNDYGYYRSDLQNIRDLITSENDVSIGLEDIYMEERNENRIKSIRKAFNVERHGLEAAELRRAISENSTLKYLQNKKYVKEKWSVIERANTL